MLLVSISKENLARITIFRSDPSGVLFVRSSRYVKKWKEIKVQMESYNTGIFTKFNFSYSFKSAFQATQRGLVGSFLSPPSSERQQHVLCHKLAFPLLHFPICPACGESHLFSWYCIFSSGILKGASFDLLQFEI